MPATSITNPYSLWLATRFGRVRARLTGTLVFTLELPTSRVEYRINFLTTQPAAKPAARGRALIHRVVGMFAALAIVLGVSAAAFTYAPSLYYSLFPVDQIEVAAREASSPMGGAYEAGTQTPQAAQVNTYLPPQDESLPEGNWLVIPRIGVRTELQQTADPNIALEKGIWWSPEHGQAGDKTQPMILAGHRFGYKWWWQSDYWKYHSFYLLPDLEPGDRVEVIADQRKWIYEVYAGHEGDEITDYNADLIMYTCKFLNSPVRHVRYARLIDPTQDTQAVAQ